MELKDLLNMKSPLLGVMLSEFENPNIVRVFRQAGFHYLMIDDEHGYFDFSRVAGLVGVASGYGLPVIVRLPGVSREYITKILDIGASGILVPMVETAEQAKEIVKYSKYAPIGHRGLSTMRAHTDYNPPRIREYLPLANERTLTFVQLETRLGIGNAEEIAKTEGVDGIFIGPNDLSSDLGMPGEVNTAAVRDAIVSVTTVGKRMNKWMGVITTNPELIDFCRGLDMNLFTNGSELDLLMKGAKERVRKFTLQAPDKTQ